MKRRAWIAKQSGAFGIRRLIIISLFVAGCSTTYVEFKGECVIQDWSLRGYTLRQRQICDLPPPDDDETQVRDREAMNVNPYPDLFDLNNNADSPAVDLLEGNMNIPQGEPDE